MGLGRWPDVSIAEAREKASEARKKLRSGVDPIQEMRSHKLRSNRLTVSDAVQNFFESKRAELKNDGHSGPGCHPSRFMYCQRLVKWRLKTLISMN